MWFLSYGPSLSKDPENPDPYTPTPYIVSPALYPNAFQDCEGCTEVTEKEITLALAVKRMKAMLRREFRSV